MLQIPTVWRHSKEMSLFPFYRQGDRWKQMKWFPKGCTESLFTGQGLNPSPQRTSQIFGHWRVCFFFWVVKWVIVNNPELLFFSPLTDLRVFSATSSFSRILYRACSAYLVESQACLSSPSALFMLQLISHPTSALSLISVPLISSSV